MTVEELIRELSDIVAQQPHRAWQTVYMMVPVEDPDDGDVYVLPFIAHATHLDGSSVELVTE